MYVYIIIYIRLDTEDHCHHYETCEMLTIIEVVNLFMKKVSKSKMTVFG